MPSSTPAGTSTSIVRAGHDAAVAATVLALGEDPPTRAVAHRARRRRHDLAEDRAAHLTHLALAAADVAARGVRARLAARAVAPWTLDRQACVDGVRDARRGVGERELDHGLGVVAAHRTRLAAARTERITAEERVEQVAEAGERVAGTAGTRRAATVAAVAEDVVAAPALGVAQHLVRAR